MFDVSALLLDDALLKYVVTARSRLVSIAAFKTVTFHRVVHGHTSGVVGVILRSKKDIQHITV